MRDADRRHHPEGRPGLVHVPTCDASRRRPFGNGAFRHHGLGRGLRMSSRRHEPMQRHQAPLAEGPGTLPVGVRTSAPRLRPLASCDGMPTADDHNHAAVSRRLPGQRSPNPSVAEFPGRTVAPSGRLGRRPNGMVVAAVPRRAGRAAKDILSDLTFLAPMFDEAASEALRAAVCDACLGGEDERGRHCRACASKRKTDRHETGTATAQQKPADSETDRLYETISPTTAAARKGAPTHPNRYLRGARPLIMGQDSGRPRPGTPAGTAHAICREIPRPTCLEELPDAAAARVMASRGWRSVNGPV